MAHCPLYCGVLHISDVVLGLIVGLLVVIVHLGLLYIKRRYFHLSHDCILSCLGYTVHCVRRFLPRRGLSFIYILHYEGVYYSLLVYFFSFYAISGSWLHNISYQSSFLGTRLWKTSHLGIFYTFFLYKDSEIKIKNTLPK